MAITIQHVSNSRSAGSSISVSPHDGSGGLTWDANDWVIVCISSRVIDFGGVTEATLTAASGFTLVGSSALTDEYRSFIVAGKVPSGYGGTFFNFVVANLSSGRYYEASCFQVRGYDGSATVSDVVDAFSAQIIEGNFNTEHSITTTNPAGTILACAQVNTLTSDWYQPDLSAGDSTWDYCNGPFDNSASQVNPTNTYARYLQSNVNSGVPISFTPEWGGSTREYVHTAVGIKRTFAAPTVVQGIGYQDKRDPPDADWSYDLWDATTVGSWLIAICTIATDDIGDITLAAGWAMYSYEEDVNGKFTSVILYKKVTVSESLFDFWSNTSGLVGDPAWNINLWEIGGLSGTSDINDVIADVEIIRGTSTGGSAQSYTPSANIGATLLYMNTRHASDVAPITQGNAGWTSQTPRVYGFYPLPPPIDPYSVGMWKQTSESEFAGGSTFYSKPQWSLSTDVVHGAQFLVALRGASGEPPPPPEKALRVTQIVVSC